ncbi:hypothetical protein [Aeromonas salmonicida]|uniref:hypothetical protein n=1 Tax=Aeromonas salmonicida TaxID=645 RepID=UPI00233092AB|nr:hypothetical protein [Aeromonas salmonicida]WCH26161.1 hypothetical protein ONZ66_16505 [Aeromonas salmonicida]
MLDVDIDSGLVLDGELYDRLTMRPLTEEQKEELGLHVANNVRRMIRSGELKPLGIHHAKSLESFFYLREIAVASITSIGDRSGPFTWDDVCSMNAADWLSVVAASMALDEVAHGCVSVVNH